MEIYDIKYRVSQQLDYIVEFMFITKFNKSRSWRPDKSIGEKFVTYTPHKKFKRTKV